jgi:hypothetical protein
LIYQSIRIFRQPLDDGLSGAGDGLGTRIRAGAVDDAGRRQLNLFTWVNGLNGARMSAPSTGVTQLPFVS